MSGKKDCVNCPDKESGPEEKAPGGMKKAGEGKVLVTGANGFVGRRLCLALHRRGVGLRVLLRDTGAEEMFKGLGAQIFTGDLADPEVAPWIVDGVDGVYHLASIVQGAELDESQFWDINYTATKRLAAAAKRAGVRKFLYCSTTGVMGNIKNPPADEAAPFNTEDIYQATKAQAEAFCLEFGKAEGLAVSVVRPGAVYGPEDRRLLKLFRMAGSGWFPVIGDGKTLIHPVHVDDLVAGIILAYEKPEAAGNVYIIAGDGPVSINQWADAIAAAAGVNLRRIRIPYLPVRLLAGAMEATLSPLGIKPPLFGRRVDFYVKTRSFSIEKARRELGFKPCVSLEEGARSTVAWYREKGWM